MDEGVSDEEKLQNERELVRSSSVKKKLLGVLRELFPAWSWDSIPSDQEYDTRTHFLHDNPLHSKFSSEVGVDKVSLCEMLYHSIPFYMSTSEEELDWSELPRLYYDLAGAERLLIVYRAWARRNSSDSEYERINSLVTSCFV